MTSRLMAFPEIVKSSLAAYKRITMPSGPVPAAVLLPLYQKDGVWKILFTKRTQNLNHHRGEISFPGGVCEPGDETLLGTALRETWEEVGILPDQVEVLGILDDVFSIHNYLVTPFVGLFPGTVPLVANPAEIDTMIEIPLDALRRPEIFRSETRTWQGHLHPVYFYRYEQYEVWGLTAAIVKQFLDIVFPGSATRDTALKQFARIPQEEACLTAS